MRLVPIPALLALALLAGCSDSSTDAAASGSGSTATITQSDGSGTSTVTRSTDGSQTIVRRSGADAGDAGQSADAAMDKMRDDAASALQR